MFLPASLRRWALLSICLLGAAPALAQDPESGVIPLGVELYRGAHASFGSVLVEEDGAGGLHMTVVLDPAVAGSRASIQHVFVSMGMNGLPSGLSVVPDDDADLQMIVYPQRHPWLTMGAEFGAVVSVNMHHDCRRHRHIRHYKHHPPGPLQMLGFTLMADEPLALSDVLGMTATRRGLVSQIGVMTYGLQLGRHHAKLGLLGGLFEADPPSDDGSGGGGDEGGEDDGGTGGGGGGGGGGGIVIPPGCLGVIDPVTGELTDVFCP